MIYYAVVNASNVVSQTGKTSSSSSDAANEMNLIGAVAITEANYNAILANKYGSTYVNGVVTALPAPVPTLAQQAMVAMGAGFTVNSTSTPAINGLYAIDTGAQAKIAFVSQYVTVNGKFPRGQTSMVWVDRNNAPHTFPSTTLFQTWASAIADYVAELDEIILSNSGTLPATSVTIA